MTKSRLIVSILLCSAMAACGGGGSGSPEGEAPAAQAPEGPGANTGSVSAAFVRSANAAYFLRGIGTQTLGMLSTSVQDTNGVLTTLNDTVLSGSSVTKEISGDASVAQGRWVAGTVTTPSGTKNLPGTDNQAYHYIAFNKLAALPTSGSASCVNGTFTAPSIVSGNTATGARAGASTGTVSVAFGTSSATVTGSISTTADGSTGVTSLNSSIASVNSAGLTGSYLSSGPGASVMLGTDGGAGYLVAIGYSVDLANGNRYSGVGYFHCT